MKKVLCLMTAAILLLAVVAWAGHGPRSQGFGHDACLGGPGTGGHPHMMGKRPYHGGPGMFLAVADEIGLSDDQIARMKKMMVEFQLARVDQKAKVEKAKIRLQSLRRDVDVSESEVMTAIDDMARTKADMQKMQYRHRSEMRAVLTDEQLDKLKELRQQKREKRFGPHQGRQPGWGRGAGHGFIPDDDD
ncbi:MAG: hypothetical protein ABII79_14735 [bacterium]